MHSQKRKQAFEDGLKAESLAKDYLITHGYAIRETRWKPFNGKGEIDIIAAIDSTIVFVEVKARNTGVEQAIDAVDARKVRNITIGADAYLRQQKYWYQYRYDIIAIDLTQTPPTIEHIPDAFLSPLFTK